jgi:uncharacterized OB-fold protein
MNKELDLGELAATVEPLMLAGGAVRLSQSGQPILLGGRCTCCETRMFPRAETCPSCMGDPVAEEEMPTVGTLYAYSVLHVGPKRFRRPLAIGYVDLSNGVRVFSHLEAHEALATGGDVELDMADVGQEPDGRPIRSFVFKPLGSK